MPGMNPMLQQAGGQQPSQQGGGNFDQNPFADLMESKASPASAMGQQQMGALMSAPQAGMPQAQGGQPGQPGQPMEMPMGMQALQAGKTGDSTKPLLGAIAQLHGYIAAITDPEEIQMVRQIVSLLTNLIQRDQERSSQEMMQGGQVSPMGALGGQQNQ